MSGVTKQVVMHAALAIQQHGVTFIGGHPMAGSHNRGVTAGRANLFENAFYLLVPGRTNQGSRFNGCKHCYKRLTSNG
ncbi:prephenate dehydrogenase/arogenate dehydrogenase family protein [Lactiplantibacillus plantarum]|uniref:prephenate dehydrogenase/arogenate dehydrogenase family protein n=1 Tax=Lactiplantibacillus plantarum TaxID=1590 RepID=UPI003709AAD5